MKYKSLGSKLEACDVIKIGMVYYYYYYYYFFFKQMFKLSSSSSY